MPLKRVIRLIHVLNFTTRGCLETRGNRQCGYEFQTVSSKNSNAPFDAITESRVDVIFKQTRLTTKRIGS